MDTPCASITRFARLLYGSFNCFSGGRREYRSWPVCVLYTHQWPQVWPTGKSRCCRSRTCSIPSIREPRHECSLKEPCLTSPSWRSSWRRRKQCLSFGRYSTSTLRLSIAYLPVDAAAVIAVPPRRPFPLPPTSPLQRSGVFVMSVKVECPVGPSWNLNSINTLSRCSLASTRPIHCRNCSRTCQSDLPELYGKA